jgi:diguanylate cyclase (GGDEF)-like protein
MAINFFTQSALNASAGKNSYHKSPGAGQIKLVHLTQSAADKTRVMSWLRKALMGLALFALAGSFLFPDSAFAVLMTFAMVGACEMAIWTGVNQHRPKRSWQSHLQHPDPWMLLGAGTAVRAPIALFHLSSSSFASSVDTVLNAVMIAMTAFALVEMLRQRFGDRVRDHCLEAIILAGTVSLALWVTLVEPVLRTHNVDIGNGLSSAASITITVVLASLAVYLLTSFEHRQSAFTGLAVSQLLPVIASLLSFYGKYTGGHHWSDFASGLPLVALAFIGTSALEPSMALYEEPSMPAGARLGRLRLAIIIVPVVLGPLTLTLSITNILVLSPLAVAIYTITLSILVVGHLIDMVQARASSSHWASHDKLTGLPNRALFRERTAQALERARRFGYSVSIMYLDLDRFKHINDSMGHEAGDQLLEQVARRILASVDAGDTVARLGGDEFAILLPSVNGDEIPRKLARRLLKSFSKPFNLKPRPVFMSPSVGISISEGNASLETLLTQADTAMYRAKETGRNNFAVWSQEMNEASKQRLMLETHLHSAIANDELRLVFQPKVELVSGHIVGCEALVRWHHPKLGIISPAVFIHVAEESGLINQIGEWVLQSACEQGRAWYDAGFENIRIAVNLSSRQFQQQKVADLVSSALRHSQLTSNLLELELTESVAMSGDEATMNSLNELREMGVVTSIDDFGTGYSNLSYLSRFPINNLKIDKSFIQQIDKSGGDAAIVVAIIAMAHGLGLNVIAEGVETPEQAAFLVRHRCDEMQGYLFSKPLPPRDFEGLLLLERATALTKPAVDESTMSHNHDRRIERAMPDRERLFSHAANAADGPKLRIPAPWDPYSH